MNRSIAPLVLALLIAPTQVRAVDYAAEVKPVLARRCYACHGALQKKAGLRLDTGAAIRRGGDGGPAVEPWHADESPLIDRLTEPDPELRMPPEGEPLTPAEIEAIRTWIDAGAETPADERPQADPRDHWSFRPPVRPEVPPAPSSDPDWVRNPVDAFLAAEHRARGLTPAPAADRATLLRRASVDLTGLVPTPEELRAFLADESPDAYERAVDRMLASPRYGERWGRHWMDVWRYSDWAGFGAEVREGQPHVWRWRDWIIESLNKDTGYDRMVVAMLAGDEVAPEDPDTLRATGYLARSWYKFNRNIWLQNTVDHAAKAFLGVTFNCARCHDHKYDPIVQEDYYRLRAFFEPHDVRVDRVPGHRETSKTGLVRVQDVHQEAPTFLYVRGEEKQPVKDRPLVPGLPAFLGRSPAIEPVSLAPTAYYPGLLPRIRSEELAAAEAALKQAEGERTAAREAADRAGSERTVLAASLDATPAALAELDAKRDRAERDAKVAGLAVDAARAELEALRARIAADDARYLAPPDSKRAEILALTAGRAERSAKLARAGADLERATRALEDARAKAAATPADSKAAQAVAAAEKAEADARKARDEAAGAAGKLSREYASIGPVHPAKSTGRRLALARWIVARDNPLAARVAINHIWARHFGKPLVSTVFDFGLNGKPPSHPALLDWLAVELMDRGWSLKAIHRLILTSNAYRMRSSADPSDPNASIDPENRFYWRMNVRRMEAEAVRDNLLHVAGKLDLTMGGPEIDQQQGMTVPRRSVYFRHAAEKQVLFLKVFDAANVNACYRRDESIVPQQALALANSPLALGQARALAGTLTESTGGPAAAATDPAFVAAAFERVLARPATSEEASACLGYLAAQAAALADPSRLTAFAEGPAAPVAASADPRQRAREGLVHVLLNHNDFVTIR